MRVRHGAALSDPSPVPQARPRFKVVFKDGFAFAQEEGRSWRIAEVARNEMLWAPDGMRFAYVKAAPTKASPTKAARAPSKVATPGAARPGKAAKTPSKAKGPARASGRYQVVIRNIRGDSVNAFPVYRPGKPSQLDWIDDRSICYRAPPDKSGGAYVVHSADSGEILSIRRGKAFVWSPGKKRLAYVAGRKQHVIKVDSERVWPRKTTRGRRKIVSDLVWSLDGAGLTFIEKNGRKSRLVVLLVVDDANGDLTWILPRSASNGVNKLFWAESKVLIGESTFKPRFAASWRRIQ